MANHAKTTSDSVSASASVEAGSNSEPKVAVSAGVAVEASTSIEPLPFKAEDYRREIKRVKRRRRRRIFFGVILALLIAAAVAAAVVFKVPGSLHVVHGDDMNPILADGQVVLTQEINQPELNDVVVFKLSSGEERVERVVALAGDWVNMASDGTIVISATPLEGNSAAGIVNGNATINASRQVPVGYCYVLGDAVTSGQGAVTVPDNFVACEDIQGKVTYKVWPIINMSAVH